MDFTENFGPEHVLRHFLNICNIPHVSGHEAALCSYVKAHADKYGHSYVEDEAGNLIVRVKASKGHEKAAPFMIQGHMDMIEAKIDGSDHDFINDPIRLKLVDGHLLYADGTTLGADNAVGLMNMLALMEDESVVHPYLELLFTVEEENNLVGVRKVDFSQIKSRRMMNMDCGEPGVMCVSTAGAAECLARIPVRKVPLSGELMELNVKGLLGGHAGLMIDLGRLSAITAMGRVMHELYKEVPFNIVYTAHERLNSIAPAMNAVISVPKADKTKAVETVRKAYEAIGAEYKNPEENLIIELTEPSCAASLSYAEMLDDISTRDLYRLMYLMPFGVTKRDWQEKEYIMCSNNTVEIAFKDNCVELEIMIRSPEDRVKDELISRTALIAELCGAEFTILDNFSGWPYCKDSDLQRLCREAYREFCGEELKTEKENACAETGVIKGAIPDMDIICTAPYSHGAHTPYEFLDLETVEPFWEFLKIFLRKMCE